MEPVEHHGASYVAAYLGTSLTSIHNWRNDSRSDFPAPSIVIMGVGSSAAAFGWSKEQLPELRAWYAQRMKIDEATAEARWKAIDSQPLGKRTAPPTVHPDQGMLTIPASGIAA